ncbi:MAG TPA: AmmeMemoRadiSam system radical SAM enzyme [Helicobacteraceae bacterium]|nr:AmmeMemoRadiSam system radical SAM enzyme [Helicobacteraceae bacterium]
MTYFSTYDNGIACLLCEHYCFLQEGDIGLCANQKNEHNTLKTIAFNAPAALSITHIEERPFLHLQPGSTSLALGTKGCNMHCPECQNHQLTQHFNTIESLYLEPKDVVKLALENSVTSIAYSYNDPVVYYPYAKAIGSIAKEKGLKNLFQTAGLASPMMLEDIPTWVDAVHVDLKSMNPAHYKSVLGGMLASVKNTLITLSKSSSWLEVSTVIINGVNDSDEELEAMAHFIASELGAHVPWHLSAFVPSNHLEHFNETTSSSILRAYEIAKAAGLYYVYFGNVPWLNETRCPACDTLLVQRRYHEIFENNIIEGACPECQRGVKGLWQ